MGLAAAGEAIRPLPHQAEERATLAETRSAIQGVRPDGRSPGPRDGAASVLDADNESIARRPARRLRGLGSATIIVSGFGGHAAADGFPVRGEHDGADRRTEADGFPEILREEGVTASGDALHRSRHAGRSRAAP